MGETLLSPKVTFTLASNNDELERAQARAARAASIRRKTMEPPPPSPPIDPCLTKQQIAELFQNCIQLASQNKINQKNTWELKLIDHLSEIIKVETVDDAETNFQKASCTLEAGVKIYSVRVDSVHSEAYKVLGRMIRAGGEDEQQTVVEGDDIKNGQDEGTSKKEIERKISPLSTLEPSFEALNVKKFDVAFAVDPLYHQTSAQFDEGGAKGLLLNNLGVYGGCRVLFDSLEVPRNCMSRPNQYANSNMVDVSFAREFIEQMVINMHRKNEICPTLTNIVGQFEEDDQSFSHAFSEGQKSAVIDDQFDGSNNDYTFGNFEPRNFDHDEESGVVDESFNFKDTTSLSHNEVDCRTSHEIDVEGRFEEFAVYLFHGLALPSKQNAWAGPDHWKFRKHKGSEDVPATESRSGSTTKRPKNKTYMEVDIDFTKSLDQELPDIFAPPKNPKSLLITTNRVPQGNTLPEDCHYQPEDLVKLFLLPNVMCLGKRRRQLSDDNSWKHNNDFDEQLPSWDNESMVDHQHGGECVHSDVDDFDELVCQPRQVTKIDVQYDRTSKQVDIHVLKETLWEHLQGSVKDPEMVCKDPISFKHVLSTFPDDCQAAAPEHISPHLCFICLLHLANEHSLSIDNCPTLDDLTIHLPSSRGNMREVSQVPS